MSNHPATIKAVLAADATLTGILTGGIYTYRETGRLGISRTTTPNAFLDGFLRPTALIKGRQELADGEIQDSDGQFSTTRQVIEIYLYDDGDNNYSTLETARTRIYALLQNKQLTGIAEIVFVGDIDDLREQELDNAALLRQDWLVHSTKST